MANVKRTLGQVLLAIGGVLALGGMASFVLPRVELHAPGGIVTSVAGRLAWIGVTLALALVGLALLRWAAAQRGRARYGAG